MQIRSSGVILRWLNNFIYNFFFFNEDEKRGPEFCLEKKETKEGHFTGSMSRFDENDRVGQLDNKFKKKKRNLKFQVYIEQ